MIMDMEKLEEELKRDEGLRLMPYRDTKGKLTIGVGRNLSDVGISEGEALIFLRNDIGDAIHALDKRLPWWRELDPIRQRVLVNMCFNLGIEKLLGFKNTLDLIHTAVCAVTGGAREALFASAARAMLASEWAKQVGDRAERLAFMMEHGITKS
jgi:lysozyme